jgi:uncharacterized protein
MTRDDRFTIRFAGEDWLAMPDGALFWQRRRILLVADLHLEKASFFAHHGQPLPPYDSRETLARLAAVAAQTNPLRIWCLGDSFHDEAGQARLDPLAARALEALAARHAFRFIAGNHDGLPDGLWGTSATDEEVDQGIMFRHCHDPHDPRPQISGHYHPKLGVAVRGHAVRRPCFVVGTHALILPAFGSLTGGLDVDDPAIAGLFPGGFDAVVATPNGIARFARGDVAKMSQRASERAV